MKRELRRVDFPAPFLPMSPVIFPCGRENETLVLRPKESYDGAIPSGNSLMASVMVRLQELLPDCPLNSALEKQLAYLSGEAQSYPAGCAQFLMALSDMREPPVKITAVGEPGELAELPFRAPLGSLVWVLERETDEYKRINDRATYYVCSGHRCLLPVNPLTDELLNRRR